MLRFISIVLFGIVFICSTGGEDLLTTLKEKLRKELSEIGYTDLNEDRKSAIDALILRTYEVSLGLCAAQKLDQGQISVEPYSVIFSTDINEYDQPVNDLKTIFFEDERVFIFVKWNMPIGLHDYLCKVYDASGKEVLRSRMVMDVKDIQWNTWTWYRINTKIDMPGLWKFEIYLDGQKYIDEGFPIQE